jgi:hypothetical protein
MIFERLFVLCSTPMLLPEYCHHYTDAKMIFQTSHALEFGLKITERDPSNSRVISVRCQFCVFFGREEVVGSKRIRTVNIKHFSTFRADGYKRHVQSQHAEAWKKYQAIGDKAEKEAFFMNVNMPFAIICTLIWKVSGRYNFSLARPSLKSLLVIFFSTLTMFAGLHKVVL